MTYVRWFSGAVFLEHAVLPALFGINAPEIRVHGGNV